MATESKRTITYQQLKEHGTKENLWVLIEGKVYDCTTFIHEHPGGYGTMVEGAGNGMDSTGPFRDQGHSDIATDMLPDLYLGEFDESSRPSEKQLASHNGLSRQPYFKFAAFLVSFIAYLGWRISFRA